MNRAVEAANKNIKKILRKMIDNQQGWHEMLPYALYIKPIELTSNEEGDQLSVNTVKYTISHLNCTFKLTSFISVFVKSIRKDELSKKNYRCGRHQKGCSTTWNFFLTANWYIVHKGVSNS